MYFHLLKLLIRCAKTTLTAGLHRPIVVWFSSSVTGTKGRFLGETFVIFFNLSLNEIMINTLNITRPVMD